MKIKKIVYGSPDEPINDIIKRAGIVTIGNTWVYGGKTVQRPAGSDWQTRIRENFGIKIVLKNGPK